MKIIVVLCEKCTYYMRQKRDSMLCIAIWHPIRV